MLIKSIELENIRSYKKEKISFSEGINFLSGDIGTGKSSILQAIEFALIGFNLTDLKGSNLLRNGENSASVKLILLNKNKNKKIEEIEIFRKIKKSKSNNINQENGFIKLNNSIIELSANELNSKIFEILNFPKEFLRKDKNLVYRFTIYTPQEQLKEIISPSKIEKRLEIIRKIFVIDKYKQLINAISIYNSKIREDKKYLEAKIENNEKIYLQIINIENEIKNLKEKLLNLNNLNKPIKKKIENLNFDITKKNELIEKIYEKNILIEKNLSKIEAIENQIKMLEFDLKLKNKEIEEIEKINFEIESNYILKNIEELNNNNKKIILNIKTEEKEEIKIEYLEKEIYKFEIEIKNIEDFILENKKIQNNINELVICQTCKQKVSLEHKTKFEKLKKEEINLKEFEKKKLKEKINFNKNKILKKLKGENSIKSVISKLNNEKNKIESENLNLNLKFEKLKNKIKNKENLKEEILNINNKLKKLNLIICKKKDLNNKKVFVKKKEFEIKNNLNKIKIELEDIRIKEKNSSNELTEIKTKLTYLNKELELKNKEKLDFEKNQKNYKLLLETENFLSKDMIELSQNIEKIVFSKFYSEFNEEFEKFFKELIEDNEIEVRLDSDFSPIIEQNGYDIDLNNLSGGEKSSLAISYRFGLKKIIENNLESSQKLSLLILDEPTDGFSTNQVDRLGLILKDLNLKQIILVSHDNRIDSICDNIIKINKENHISSVIN